MTVRFEGGATANVQISWLAPRKMRQMVVVGSHRMVQYEDTSSDESVRIYDRGLDFSQVQAPATFGEYQLTYRSGDIVVPRIDAAEPLWLELADFAHAIGTGEEPRSSARWGSRSCARLRRRIARWSGRANRSSSTARYPRAPRARAAWTTARPYPGQIGSCKSRPPIAGHRRSWATDEPQAAGDRGRPMSSRLRVIVGDR